MMYTNKPNRLQGFDYSHDNCYFITTVVKNRIPCLGTIDSGNLELSVYGQIVQDQIHWLSNHFSFVKIHESVVMPDHVHVLIEIDARGSSDERIKSLSELIGAFKMTSSKQIHLNGLNDFQWQRSFHDRIVRNDEEFQRIKNYIQMNPVEWYNLMN